MTRHIAAFFSWSRAVLAVLDAHVVVTPRESAAGAEQTYTVPVPTKRLYQSVVARA